MEGEHTRIFREKLSQWIASQGFWFQLRHSMQGGGGWSMTVYHLIRIGVRCIVVLAVVATGLGFYFLKRPGLKSYQAGLNQKLVEALGAKEVNFQHFGRSQGAFKVGQFAVEGGPETFYNRLDAAQVEFTPTSFLSGTVKPWSVNTIRAGQIIMNLKTGADSAEEAQALSRSLIKHYPDFNFNGLEVASATLTWGFTSAERQGRGFSTQGRIENSAMTASRTDAGWHLEFKGGTFSQNWLEKADLISLTADCDANGVRIPEASLTLGGAPIHLTNVMIGAGEKPQVSGTMTIANLDVQQVLPPGLKDFIEGSISGNFRLSGSTNTAEGIVAEAVVKLEGRDSIRLRDRLPVLKAMTVLDNFHSYKKVEFTEGSFRLVTTAQKISISALSMQSRELMDLNGAFTVRMPTAQELSQIGATQSAGLGGDFGASGANGPDQDASGNGNGKKENKDITLKQAGKLANESQPFPDEAPQQNDLFDQHARERWQQQQANSETMDRLSRALRYEGEVTLGVPADAFDRSEILKQKYPVDPATKRIPLKIPFEGQIGSVSLEFHKSLLEDGAKK